MERDQGADTHGQFVSGTIDLPVLGHDHPAGWTMQLWPAIASEPDMRLNRI